MLSDPSSFNLAPGFSSLEPGDVLKDIEAERKRQGCPINLPFSIILSIPATELIPPQRPPTIPVKSKHFKQHEFVSFSLRPEENNEKKETPYRYFNKTVNFQFCLKRSLSKQILNYRGQIITIQSMHSLLVHSVNRRVLLPEVACNSSVSNVDNRTSLNQASTSYSCAKRTSRQLRGRTRPLRCEVVSKASSLRTFWLPMMRRLQCGWATLADGSEGGSYSLSRLPTPCPHVAMSPPHQTTIPEMA